MLVDDNPADIDLTRDALMRSRFPHVVNAVSDGVQAMNYLQRQGSYGSASMPDLIILDLNLPAKDGRAVLQEVRLDERLGNTPIVIFSTSRSKQDVNRSYELGANSYVTKPGNLKEYFQCIASIAEFWLGYVQLPRKETHD